MGQSGYFTIINMLDTSISQISPKELLQKDLSPPLEPRKYLISLTNRYYLFYVFKPNYQCFVASPRKDREYFEKHIYIGSIIKSLYNTLIDSMDWLFAGIQHSKITPKKFTPYVILRKRNASRQDSRKSVQRDPRTI